MEKRTLSDIIRLDGIKAKGYGTIPKFIMHDRDMTLESKAIYGYFCALCGSGVETFPSRNTILSNLRLSKDGYYNHYNALKEHGYITVSKLDPSDIKSQNVYTIAAKPPKVAEHISLNSSSLEKQRLANSGIDAYGYGILPKAVMIDERLDVKAKGIYCYFASYAGAGDTAFPSKENILYHLNISEKPYYRYLNQLIQYNYIIVIQRREKGRVAGCDYILNQMPDEEIGAAIQESRRNRTQSPIGKNQDVANQDTIIISSSINRFSNNSIINQSEKTVPPSIDLIDNTNNIKLLSKDDVAEKITLQELLNENPSKSELINFIYNILCETLTVKPKSPYVWINKRNTPFQEVFDAFSLINKKHIEYVLFSCYNNDNIFKAKNPKAYVKFALMRSTLTIENFDNRRFEKLETRTPEQIKREELFHAKIKRDQERMFKQSYESDQKNNFRQDDGHNY